MRLWKLFLAYFRLSKLAVCEMSRGAREFHDYLDDSPDDPWPVHGWTYHCGRCGKAFQL